MTRSTPTGMPSEPKARAPLPDPFYYLGNFQTVVSSLDERYADLWSAEERQFIADFDELPRASRALLVRMIMRKGVTFRASRLSYIEIGDVFAALAPLLQLGWVDDEPSLDLDQLQALLRKEELLLYFPLPRACGKLKKVELVDMLRRQYPGSKRFAAWCSGADERVYEIMVASLCERLRLMFFGNYHQDWTEFVLADLGVFAYEKISPSPHWRPFSRRGHIDAFQQLYLCRQGLDAGRDLKTVISAIPAPLADCCWLEDRRQKLLFQVARASEQAGDSATALELYSTCTHPGARLRSIRLRERAKEWKLARELCLTAQQSPESDAERQQLCRLLPRLNRRLGICDGVPTATASVCAFELVLDIPRHARNVEYCVLDHLMHQGTGTTTVHYVENGLVNSLFGLLCWNVIFAPLPGAFFHDFQSGPADLSSTFFYQRRQREFAECFAHFETDRYKETIRRCFTAKAGIQSPFVTWRLLTEPLLESALRCIPAAHLKIWFEWIVRDMGENRAGFPDLVQFWPLEQQYRMIEVKGPGDRLQDNQRRLLELCASHQMPVSVCHVRWAAMPPAGAPAACSSRLH